MRGTVHLFTVPRFECETVYLSLRACVRLECADQGEIRRQEWKSPGSNALVLLLYMLCDFVLFAVDSVSISP